MSCELSAHRGAITGLDFHPVELVLASSSSDQTVSHMLTYGWGDSAATQIPHRRRCFVAAVPVHSSKPLLNMRYCLLLISMPYPVTCILRPSLVQARFWSVEGLPPRLLSVSPSIPSPLAACHFVPPQTGSALAAVTSDGVRMLSFNGASAAAAGGSVAPFRTETLDAVDVPLGPAVACTWAGSNLRAGGGVSVAAASGTPAVHLLAASLSGSIVSVWSANLSRLAPLAPKALHPAFASRESPSMSAPVAGAPAASAASGAATAPSMAATSAATRAAHAHSPSRKLASSPAQPAVAASLLDSGAEAGAAPRVRVRVPIPVKSVSLTSADDHHDAAASGRGGNDDTGLDSGDYVDAVDHNYLSSDAKDDIPLAKPAPSASTAAVCEVRAQSYDGKAASPEHSLQHARRPAPVPAAALVPTAVSAAGAGRPPIGLASAAADEEETKYSEDSFEDDEEEAGHRHDSQGRRQQPPLPSRHGSEQVEVPMSVPGSVGRLAHSPITALDDTGDTGFAPPKVADAGDGRQPSPSPAAALAAAPASQSAPPTHHPRQVPAVPVAVASASAAVDAPSHLLPQPQQSGRRGAAAGPDLASALAPALAMAEQAAAIAAAALAAAPIRRKSLTHRGERDRERDRDRDSISASAAAPAADGPGKASIGDAVHVTASSTPAASTPAVAPFSASPPQSSKAPATAAQQAAAAEPAVDPAGKSALPPGSIATEQVTASAARSAALASGKGSSLGGASGKAAAQHPVSGDPPSKQLSKHRGDVGPVRPVDGPDGTDADFAPALPLVPATRHTPVGLDLAAFLPVNNARGFGASRVLPAASTAAALAASFRNPSSASASASGAAPRLPPSLPAAAYPNSGLAHRPSTGDASRGRSRATGSGSDKQPSPPPPASQSQPQFQHDPFAASADGGGSDNPQACPSRSPAAAIALRSLQREHGSTLRALRFRREEMASASSLWASGDVPAAVAVLRVAAHSDPVIGADFLRQFALERCGGAVGLDAAEAVLRLAGATLATASSSPQPARMLLATTPPGSAIVPPASSSEAETAPASAPIASPAAAALSAFAATLRAFGSFIASTMGSAAGAAVASAATGRDGVASNHDSEMDLAAEERARRCLTALRAFEATRADVQAAARVLASLAAAGEASARTEASRAGEVLQQYESWRSSLPLHAVVAAARPSTAAAGGSAGGMPSP